MRAVLAVAVTEVDICAAACKQRAKYVIFSGFQNFCLFNSMIFLFFLMIHLLLQWHPAYNGPKMCTKWDLPQFIHFVAKSCETPRKMSYSVQNSIWFPHVRLKVSELLNAINWFKPFSKDPLNFDVKVTPTDHWFRTNNLKPLWPSLPGSRSTVCWVVSMNQTQ